MLIQKSRSIFSLVCGIFDAFMRSYRPCAKASALKPIALHITRALCKHQLCIHVAKAVGAVGPSSLHVTIEPCICSTQCPSARSLVRGFRVSHVDHVCSAMTKIGSQNCRLGDVANTCASALLRQHRKGFFSRR